MPKPSVAEPKPIAVYIRVSSRDQKTDSQRRSITEWLAKAGYDLDQVGWYVDIESGRTMKRPEFDRFRADIFHGTIKTVVVYKIDRLARRLHERLGSRPRLYRLGAGTPGSRLGPLTIPSEPRDGLVRRGGGPAATPARVGRGEPGHTRSTRRAQFGQPIRPGAAVGRTTHLF